MNNFELLSGPPLDVHIHRYNFSDQTPLVDGVFVRFSCGDRLRYAEFASGDGALSSVLGKLSDTLFLIAGGCGYRLQGACGEEVSPIEVSPVKEYREISSDALLFASDHSLAYYVSGRMSWRRSVCSESLRLLKVSHSVITGTGWDAPTGREVYFALNTPDGASLPVREYP